MAILNPLIRFAAEIETESQSIFRHSQRARGVGQSQYFKYATRLLQSLLSFAMTLRHGLKMEVING